MSSDTLDLMCGEPAHQLLNDRQFIEAWHALSDACPHSTAFQSPAFASAWYAAYKADWQPVLVRNHNADGILTGLWLLAYNESSRELAHAGTYQAEYHVWLCRPGADAAFLTAAWALLRSRLTFSTLRLKYLPSAALGDVLQAALGQQGAVAVQRSVRPLLRLDAEEVKATAKKSSNKNRYNRLKKLGNLEFRRITTSAELDEIFDELIAFYDLRQGAVNDSTPFRDDAQKRVFHRDLFARAPQHTYVTATYLDGRPVAAFWGVVSGKTVQLCLQIGSPFYAGYSPGVVHIRQVSEQLLSDGYDLLDLTPGGDAWKERFANSHDEVADATVYCSTWTRRRSDSAATVSQSAKTCATLVGIKPDQVRSALAAARRATPAALARKVRNWFSERREIRVYRADRDMANKFPSDARVRCNSLPDLLSFEPGEPWQTRHRFFSSALARIEDGSRPYTLSIGNRLAHSGWMGMNQTTSHISEVEQTMSFPPGSVALYDFYTHPDFRGAGHYRHTVGHMLRAAFEAETTQHAYISVLADNGPSRHVIEKMGFAYQGSFYWEKRFGKVRKWAGATMIALETADA